ncbi:MAG TPA: hypothetical protein VGM95_07030 [Lactobacillaceae bacterium]|jgi:CRISPR/Cas system-associated endonuclease Cas1
MANEFNLASDLIEPFRPVVDQIMKRYEQAEFDLNMKLELVGALNYNIQFNRHESVVTSAMAEMVRQAVDYLNGKTALPTWEVVL